MYLNFPLVWPRKVSLHDIIPSHQFPCLLSLAMLPSSFLFLLHSLLLHPRESCLCAILVIVCSPVVTHGNVCRLLVYLFYQPYPVICLSLNCSCNQTPSALLYKCFSCLGFSLMNRQSQCWFGVFPASSFLCSTNHKNATSLVSQWNGTIYLLTSAVETELPFSYFGYELLALFSCFRDPSTDRGQRTAPVSPVS